MKGCSDGGRRNTVTQTRESISVSDRLSAGLRGEVSAAVFTHSAASSCDRAAHSGLWNSKLRIERLAHSPDSCSM